MSYKTSPTSNSPKSLSTWLTSTTSDMIFSQRPKPLLYGFSNQHKGQSSHISSAKCKIVEPNDIVNIICPKSFSTWHMSTTSDKIFSQRMDNSQRPKPLPYSFSNQHEGQPSHISSAECKIVEPNDIINIISPKSFST